VLVIGGGHRLTIATLEATASIPIVDREQRIGDNNNATMRCCSK
jgi:hypothetical protein